MEVVTEHLFPWNMFSVVSYEYHLWPVDLHYRDSDVYKRQVQLMPAPSSRQIWRKARSVTPAMGARYSLECISTFPIYMKGSFVRTAFLPDIVPQKFPIDNQMCIRDRLFCEDLERYGRGEKPLRLVDRRIGY